MAWRWLVLFPCLCAADNIQNQAVCGELAEEQWDTLTLLQIELAIQPNSTGNSSQARSAPAAKSQPDAQRGLKEHFQWWIPLLRMSLLCLTFVIAHGWLFRRWKAIFLFLIPLELVTYPSSIVSMEENHVFFWAKAFSVALALEVVTALCVACAPAAAAWPLSCIHPFCARHLKGRFWPFMVLYLALSVNILEAVLTDLAHQRTLNVLAGLCLIASTPVPGAILFQYPLDLIRKYNMGAQADLQGLDATEEDLKARVSDWYVTLLQTGSSSVPFADFCCRLPLSWIWLYTSWNACFMLDISILTDWNLAVLLVPLLEGHRISSVSQIHGVASYPWMNSHWLQARTFSLWLWFSLQGPLHKDYFDNAFAFRDWFQLTQHEEDEVAHYWGAFNLLWAVIHLAWFWHRAHRLSQASTYEKEATSGVD